MGLLQICLEKQLKVTAETLPGISAYHCLVCLRDALVFLATPVK